MADDHDVHDGAHAGDEDDDHGHGHDDHGAHAPESSSWVLLPIAAGVVVAIVLLLILGLHGGASPVG